MTGSSFWIFGLAVILNSIELSSQSGTTRKKGQGFRESGIPSPLGYSSRDLPYRKVRCPTEEQRTDKTTFLIKHANGTFEDCTPDKILLALGPTIVGFILNDVIRPIFSRIDGEIVYDESTNEQIKVSIGYLQRSFGVCGPVPENIKRLSVIQPFGVFSPTRSSNPTRPTMTRSASERVPGFISRFGSDPNSSSATSRSSSRSSKNLLSRIFSRPSSSSAIPPSNEESRSGKKD